MKLTKKGIFITFEKTAEGLGGTTQALLLSDFLKIKGIETVSTRESGGTPVGLKIREILHNKDNALADATEVFLFQADRAQHVAKVIRPSLEAGKVVISDRYVDSSLVYQGWCRGWKIDDLLQLHHLATGSLYPDLTIVLVGTPHVALDTTDRFEALGEDFHAQVKEGMLHFARVNPRFEIINANQSIEKVFTDILEVVRKRFPELNLPTELTD